MPYKLLFVCLGNICRSPSAENITNYLIEKRNWGDRVICDSAGTSDYHIGRPPDPRMAIAAKEILDIDLLGKARQFDPADFEKFDLILAMDRENYDDILSLDRPGKYLDKVRLMCSFCRRYDIKDVPDPYYGGPQGFNRVIDILTDACEGLLDELEQEQKV